MASLLNKAEVRKYVLTRFAETRPDAGITRWSAESWVAIEAWLKAKLDGEVHQHPSVGHTCKF